MERRSRKLILWMITFTLTSGERIQFYVKAQTKIDAMVKADGYLYLADVLKLNKKFILRD